VLLAVVCPFVAWAQTTGSITGFVTDGSGAPIAGATIVATGVNLQGTRTAATATDGIYRIPLLPPGDYHVRATVTGFRAVERDTTVRIAATATIDFSLEAAAEEQVLVRATPPLIDLSSTTTGTSYTSDVVARLPVARNYADVIQANPGVLTDIGATNGRFVPLAINGATSAENQWYIDGVNTTYVSTNIQGTAIHNEFIQEVSVMTGGYQAEYGRALGGVINAVTKAGGNSFHGDGFAYYDSLATGADVQYRPGDTDTPSVRVSSSEHWDYGIDLGGFILKDRLWFFGAYNRITLQTEESAIAGNQVSPNLYPTYSTSNFYSGKLTWNVATGTTIVGSVFADPSNQSGLANGVVPYGSNPDKSTWWSYLAQGGTDFAVSVSQLFGSRAIVTAQGSEHHDRNAGSAADGIQYVDFTCQGGTHEQPCTPPFTPNAVWGGYGNVPGLRSSRSQFATQGTYYAGDHELKAGGDYMNGKTDSYVFTSGGQIVILNNQWGQSYYRHQFFSYDPANLTPATYRTRNAQIIDYGTYAQDSWKVASNFTVNLGLRWDGEQVSNYAGQTVINFGAEWQPRVGVVWDPWKDGATKISAFAGRFNYGVSTALALANFVSFPALVRTFNFDPINVTPDPNVYHQHTQIIPGSPFGAPVDSGIKPWLQDEVTVAVQRLILPSLTVEVQGSYRSLGNAMEDRCDFDYTAPIMNGTNCALINPGSGAQFARGDAPVCNGFFSYTYPDAYQCYDHGGPPTPAAKRYYRAIGLLAHQTVGDKLWLQASYVYTSLTGNYDGAVNEGIFQQFRGQTTPGFDWDFNYPPLWLHNSNGTLTLDRPFHFRVDGFWVSPWRLSIGLQAYAESGAPLNKLGFFSSQYGSVIPLVPRGSAGRLPTLWGTNLTISYPLVVGPATVTLQGYLYNVFNKQIATSKDQAWTITEPAGYPDTIYDPNQPSNNPNYGAVTGRSPPRLFSAAVKVSF
jgi:hypothetical protein